VTGQLTAYDTTVFLVGEYTEEHGRQLPEFAIADGSCSLCARICRPDERFLRVLKWQRLHRGTARFRHGWDTRLSAPGESRDSKGTRTRGPYSPVGG
jgi:hypothetical protein